MTRKEFMRELQERLKQLPKEDLAIALDYYEEYFDEAGKEREQDVIAELKSPAHIASKILADYAIKEAKVVRSSTKSGWRAFWFTILAICAAPVAVPIIIAAVAVIVSLAVTGIALIFALAVSAGAVFLKGVLLLVGGSVSALIFVGVALVLAGAAMLVFYITGMLITGIAKLINRRSK
ncbi:DUF1700 domain-containing protein [Treponema phagedenis]|uniref:DUF1700 domain-containing protein n=1 Tax=Treponema phagedenis TaxID=162 RepID=A0A0B7GS69_TREPH|nr:DUF1700 domain-containing protein [Treponema phagedenis]NVP25555.1 DUF1700 domain-containing protein [Treponema phagedenis]QEJ94097.1 DUF1700 domain-containing protein [Treponema phagedenis]QEJ97418.1 DUF1700 domain-containing protein [Treponema phagedenis]QEK01892.1 DUF1700 domain-containing protein [Treponema phagedenis]QEK02452.1 DUF1700 domain-containing protein [Treponema phagedenis]